MHAFTGSLFLIVPSSTEHEQDSCSLHCSLIYRTVPSSTREDTVVANTMTKKVNEQDTKHFQNVIVSAHRRILGMVRCCVFYSKYLCHVSHSTS